MVFAHIAVDGLTTTWKTCINLNEAAGWKVCDLVEGWAAGKSLDTGYDVWDAHGCSIQPHFKMGVVVAVMDIIFIGYAVLRIYFDL